MTALTLGAPIERLRRRFAKRPLAAIVEAAARAGYLARGAVYLSIGAMAVLAALNVTPRAQGAIGAMEAWGRWPVGLILLWIVGLGLYGFAGWRGLQSIFDADRCGRTPGGLVTRAGQAISGITYAGLAISVFGLVDAIEDLQEADDQAATHAAVAAALDLPMGGLVVIAMGLFILAAGVGSVARAFVDHFGRGLDCAVSTRAWAGTVARIGYAGRGAALLPAGAALTGAGLHARASEARGLGGALEALSGLPFGGWALGLIGLGLIAFGVYAAIEGWLRPIRMPRA